MTMSRSVALGLLAVTAWIHFKDIPDKLGETAYLGWLYILLVVGCAAAGAWLLSERWRLGYLLGAVISFGAILGYSLTRSVGLPDATGDIGNWAEPTGVISLIVEVAFVVLAVQELRRSGLRLT
ncbi:hypothetical protein HNQ07_003958 [Deinococcus metalli]|uniref:Uncharacterized protein n=1 Tax=Deinococcus metalli TaxID=1141878 RepID=A0A7W8KK59_9DEIO|nr:hypothetical protein [Deinococcus metalli]MBB5378451.1 hypothetical protein [Deinococcus metalli]GHF57804.1 hypothetical protein GCM10017781_37510 [Deinococcus metalli]